MMAYLTMMAARLAELHRVLKPTGSLYLHCDPTASHYIKLLLDSIFGFINFRNEIIWKRSHAHSSAKRYGPNHDVILFYGKTSEMKWKPVFQDYKTEYIEKNYSHIDDNGRRYKHENPTGAGIRRGLTGQPWRGIDPTTKYRHWVRPPDELEILDREGKIYWPKKEGAWPYIKVYLDEMKGIRPKIFGLISMSLI
jgi:DNA methylase